MLHPFKTGLFLSLTLVFQTVFAELPAQAMTSPQDPIGILLNQGEKSKYYFKAWKDLSLSAANRNALLKQNQELDLEAARTTDSAEFKQVFKINHLFFWGEDLTRVSFLGSHGDIVMMDWPAGVKGGQVCKLWFNGNGGFAGIRNQACTPN
ncbi:hypothetical protein COW36_22670 [bacterium (Candidatus Blackallbacteria) CG17_big_fil_post_rev_8_21_14_2_50_48_46]|uniref:Uncharacterized protein n=1 Tax=bacterium (Candidatus Blackallbacteria) CG17_big_fil_post_rev_8_21_14_2_50_48_46 TaxID=2014261 RepID=A0A2M7FYC3_9BACT|nr:MAG: hypothetical protein COW64_07440 [bacterium (Candidatus Blackallbacteria) CG18_big_fil_WC_8_21_14_2_50_49_26]PIW14183.1 MAG: hypothetical protein COW36_22670 [bacterium (Candidatus Blackallbacteria) CG17_big_fil_post_rev_8_21_14_2_50_48_46]PIW46724.1 MAG: hypothetical protein COW20_14945 [bacterium (Candidatus Blackallbacteria) CG13_big_fil_rev_8_21_14_2_50_49_14]